MIESNPADGTKPTGQKFGLSDEEFVVIWQMSRSAKTAAAAVSKLTGVRVTVEEVKMWVSCLRKDGVKLKRMAHKRAV